MARVLCEGADLISPWNRIGRLSVRHSASGLREDGMSPFLQEHGSTREKGPSGEECTPGRSGPLDLYSTEDHDHHLRNEAAANVILSVRFGQ